MPRLTKRIVDAAVKKDRDSYLWDEELTGFGVKIVDFRRELTLDFHREVTRL